METGEQRLDGSIPADDKRSLYDISRDDEHQGKKIKLSVLNPRTNRVGSPLPPDLFHTQQADVGIKDEAAHEPTDEAASPIASAIPYHNSSEFWLSQPLPNGIETIEPQFQQSSGIPAHHAGFDGSGNTLPVEDQLMEDWDDKPLLAQVSPGFDFDSGVSVPLNEDFFAADYLEWMASETTWEHSSKSSNVVVVDSNSHQVIRQDQHLNESETFGVHDESHSSLDEEDDYVCFGVVS